MGLGFSEGTVNALSGGVAGAANIFTGFPFDTVKVRLQASPHGTYAGPWDCARSIVKYEGVRGLYRGLAAPLVGAALETGISYTVYTYTLARLTVCAAAAAMLRATYYRLQASYQPCLLQCQSLQAWLVLF